MSDALEFSGHWRCTEPWGSEIVLEIGADGQGYDVVVIDASDGERAEVYGIKIDGDKLTFGALWSTGQFTKYVLKRFGDEIEARFTYNATARFVPNDV